MSTHVHTDNWERYLELEDNFDRTSTAATIILLGQCRDLLITIQHQLQQHFVDPHTPPSMQFKKNL